MLSLRSLVQVNMVEEALPEGGEVALETTEGGTSCSLEFTPYEVKTLLVGMSVRGDTGRKRQKL